MTLVDPTGGVGYAFGEVLPSADMTVIATNQPKAVDGSGGGTYTPSAPVNINGSGLASDNILSSTVKGTVTYDAGAHRKTRLSTSAINANSNSTIRGSGAYYDVYFQTMSLSADRTITLTESGNVADEMIEIILKDQSGFNVFVVTSGTPGSPIATFTTTSPGATTVKKARFRFTGTVWVFLDCTGTGVNP